MRENKKGGRPTQGRKKFQSYLHPELDGYLSQEALFRGVSRATILGEILSERYAKEGFLESLREES